LRNNIEKEDIMKITGMLLSSMVILLWAPASWAISLVEAEWVKGQCNEAGIRIVDVSSKPDTYVKGHLPCAVKVNRYIDLSDTSTVPPNRYPTKEQFEKLMMRLGIDKNTTVVAYDDSLSLFASRLLVLMELYGHSNDKLKLLNGGSVRWKKLGYPMSTEPARPRNTEYRVDNVRLDVFVSWSEIYRDVVLGAAPEIMLLDSRPSDEYSGKKIRSIRGGHIPDAVNVTGADAVNKEDHRFRTIAEMRKMYEDKGFTPDKTIYEYCHSGDRSAHAYVILKHLLGYKNIHFNDGGWQEWSTNLSLPAEDEVWLWEAQQKEKK
jgi:thiosulfate/3-mercaptopyruvate sulfurtransferase